MKKILAILMCALLICTFTVVASAEEAEAGEVTTEAVTTEAVDDPNDLTAEEIVDYVKEHAEEISVIVSLIASAFFAIIRNKKINGSIATVNNNAITMTENSVNAMVGMSTVVTQYKDEMATMLAEIRRNNEERAELEASLAEVSKYLKATRLANKELGDEIAKLICLANLPNSVKDEMFKTHIAAMNAIIEAEREAEEAKENEEVNAE